MQCKVSAIVPANPDCSLTLLHDKEETIHHGDDDDNGDDFSDKWKLPGCILHPDS
jgi:hypothetical protein